MSQAGATLVGAATASAHAHRASAGRERSQPRGPHARSGRLACWTAAAGAVVGCTRCAGRHASTMAVGCTLLCHWATSGFSPLAVELLFFYFLNILKSLQIQKFV
jgi:hypothetical protein